MLDTFVGFVIVALLLGIAYAHFKLHLTVASIEAKLKTLLGLTSAAASAKPAPVPTPPVAAPSAPVAPPNPAPAPAPAAPVPVALPAGFASAPDQYGYVMLTQVEADRAQYLASQDQNYVVWAKGLPKYWAIDDTLTAFASTLTEAQKTKLNTDIAQANVLAAFGGWGTWAYTVAAGIADHAAFSNGDLSPATAGVHLRNIEQALAHQREHAQAIAAGTNPTNSGAVAG